MGIISQHLDRVLTNPSLDLTSFALAADLLAWRNDSADNELEDYRPGWQSDDRRPDPVEEAEWLGFELGLDGQLHASHDDGTGSTPEWVAFLRGWVAGMRARTEREATERAEFEEWLESIDGPYPELDFYELAEGLGVQAARGIGG